MWAPPMLCKWPSADAGESHVRWFITKCHSIQAGKHSAVRPMHIEGKNPLMDNFVEAEETWYGVRGCRKRAVLQFSGLNCYCAVVSLCGRC